MSESLTGQGSPGIWSPGEPGRPQGKSLSKPRGIIMLLLALVMLSPLVSGALLLGLGTLMTPGDAGMLAQQEFLDAPGGEQIPNPDFDPVQEFFGDAVFILGLVAMSGFVTVPVAFIALFIVGITAPGAVRVVDMRPGTPVEPGDYYKPGTWYSRPVHYRPASNITPPTPEKVAAAKVLSRAALYRLAVAACVVLALVAVVAVILT